VFGYHFLKGIYLSYHTACILILETDMNTRTLGSTGPQLSALGFGCMGLIGWYGERDDAEARATLLHAVDKGITHFDTASSYQNGENEKFVGETLKPFRSKLFIASKYGITRDPEGKVVIDNKPDSLRKAVDASLQRLGTDYIDLYYLHRIDPTTPIEESVGTLAELIQAGKIRHIGLSECSANTLRRAHATHPIAAVQSEYSLWTRDPENDGVLATCRELGVGFVSYSPLGRGFLAGNFQQLKDLPTNDHRQTNPRFQGENGQHNLLIAEAIHEFAKLRNCTPAQLAIAWVLAQGNDVHTIPGTKRRSRLDENMSALDVVLSAVELAALRSKIDSIGIHGDRHPAAMMKVLQG
jgi:aryl-alcohol dehydrogenase-like predicted oxidoreductase